MGNTRPNDKDKPDISTSLQQNDGFDTDGFDINVGQDNGEDTSMSLSNALLPVIPHVESTQQVFPQADGRAMASIMMQNSSNQMRNFSASDPRFTESSVRGVPQYSNQDMMLMGNNPNRARLTNRSLLLSMNATAGHQMLRQAGEARIGPVNSPQPNGDFVTLGDKSYMMSYAQNNRQPHLGNPVNVHKERCGLQGDSEDHHGVQERTDSNFLSLGIGGNQTQTIPSTQAITSEMKTTAPPFHIQQTANNFPSLGQNLDGSFQTNVGEFVYPVSGDVRTMSRLDRIELMRQYMQRPQYGMQQYMPTPGNLNFMPTPGSLNFMPTPGNLNLSSASNRNGDCTEVDYRMLQNNQPGPSGSLGGNLAGFVNARQLYLPRTPSGSQRVVESPMNRPSLTLGGSSTRSNHAGQSITGLQYVGGHVAQNSGTPQIVYAQPSPGHLISYNNTPLTQRIRAPVAMSGAAPGAASGLPPSRFQVNANGVSQVAERNPRCSQHGPHTAGMPYQSSNPRFNLLPNNLLTATPIGRAQNVQVQIPNDVPPGFVQNRPSLKRSAMWSPPAPRYAQRQKVGPSTIVQPSKPQPPQAVPPTNETTKTVYQIKREKGRDSQPKPSGKNCYICKRDLSFPAEGPVSQPKVLPAVAFLPCGHTFHDECLKKITPEDESKEPPCIPCALGED